MELESLKDFEHSLGLSLLPEPEVEKAAKAEGITFGKNIKTRLNYLVSLGMLAHPIPVYFGKGRGGTRCFQPDILEILRFIHENKANFGLNQIAGIINERRLDLARQAWNELEIIDINIIKEIGHLSFNIMNKISELCIFNYNIMKIVILSARISSLEAYRLSTEHEISTVEDFLGKVGVSFCQEDSGKTRAYIEDRKKVSALFTKAIEESKNDQIRILDEFKVNMK